MQRLPTDCVRHILDEIAYADLPWRDLARMRDRRINGYFGIDYAIVWGANHDLQLLKQKLTRILENESGAES